MGVGGTGGNSGVDGGTGSNGGGGGGGGGNNFDNPPTVGQVGLGNPPGGSGGNGGSTIIIDSNLTNDITGGIGDDGIGGIGIGGGGGGDGAIIVTNTTLILSHKITGGNGGNGGNGGIGGIGGGGGGGGAGAGIASTAQSDITNNSTVSGGVGGSGGSGGGGGGGGGAGITSTANLTLTNTGTISGGNGGNANDGGGSGGAGVTATANLTLNNTGAISGGVGIRFGSGGAGISIANGSITNTGIITGGNGNSSQTGGQFYAQGGSGSGGAPGFIPNTPLNGYSGVGINASGGGITITNAGSIAGGTSFFGQANAITFSGAGNTLELHDGYDFTGKVVGGGTDTLILGGDDDSLFDLSEIGDQYTGFSTFVKNGNSTWTLTGSTPENTPWTVDAGTLQLGNGVTDGKITGNVLITLSATLDFNNANALDYSDVISGNGNLTKSGAGELTLSGINTYTGGTTVYDGTLLLTGSLASAVSVSSGAILSVTESGSLGGNITNNGLVVFDQSDDYTYSKEIYGSGTLKKFGTKTLTLSSNTPTFAGITSVETGKLHLTGSLFSLSQTTVQPGATISGTGAAGSLLIDSGGFITPGDNNTIGTLSVAGDYNQSGTYTCRVDSSGHNDLIDVSGTATLGNGSTLNVVPSGVFANGQSIPYIVLTSNVLNGAFTSVTGVSPLFTYQVDYTPNNAQLILTKTYHIAEIVTTGNLGSVASYMDNHAPAALEARLNALTTEQLEQALSDLDPAEETQKTDFIASIESASMSTPFTWSGMDRMAKQSGTAMAGLVQQVSSLKQSFTNLFGRKHQRSTVMQALAQASDPKQIPISARVNMGATNLWIQGGIGRFSQESTMDPSNIVIQGLDGNTYDTSVGLDHAVSNTLKIGVTTGYTVSQYTMKADRAKGGVNSARFGLYGLWEAPSSWYVNGAVYYGHHRFKADRIMTFVPIVAHQRHDGHHVSGLAEVGKDITLGKSLVLTPYVGGGALFLRENGYTEYGAGIQNLSVKSRNSTTMQGKTGIQLANLWQWHDATPIYSFARLGITYRRAVGSHQKMSAGLVGQGGSFTVRTRNRNRVLANPNVGFTATLSKDISATLAYDGELGSNQRNHQALVRVNWTF